MTVRLFERAEIDLPDDDLPRRIVHGRDLSDRIPGSPTDLEPGYYCDYNYLDYFFEVGGEEIRARCYLDESSLHIHVTDDWLQGPQAAQVLLYLQRRYDRIYTKNETGLSSVLSYQYAYA